MGLNHRMRAPVAAVYDAANVAAIGRPNLRLHSFLSDLIGLSNKPASPTATVSRDP